MAKVYAFRKDHQQIVYLEAGERKVGLASCPHHGHYQVLYPKEMPMLEKGLRERNVQGLEVSAQRVAPVFEALDAVDAGRMCPTELTERVDALLESLNPAKTN
jgi:hypothetical protein